MVESAERIRSAMNSVNVILCLKGKHVDNKNLILAYTINAKMVLNAFLQMITSMLFKNKNDKKDYYFCSSYTCECPANVSGRYCEDKVQSCKENPCLVGECLDTENGFQCKCPRGYDGRNCEVTIINTEQYV